MSEDFNHLNEEEQLKAENDFLKMKLMLESGAQFGGMDTASKLPADIENEFLKNIIAFEKQSENPVYIKLFDKIEQPTQFKPVSQIPDDEIEVEWKILLAYLNKYDINFNVCSPNISVREIYRFVTEELFEYEMDDMDMPGFTTNFIYDEFYPDPVYENSNVATDECINYILQKEPVNWTHNFRDENIRLNEHFPLTLEEFKLIPTNYKSAYSEIEIKSIDVQNCLVEEKKCYVDGTYQLTADSGEEKFQLSGNWKVNFEKDDKFGYWYIYEVQIEGIKF